MSKSRKFIKDSFMNELPEPVNTQFVARILSNQSGSSFEIEIPDDEVTFSVEGNPRSEYGLTIGVARMPAKFRNLIFVKKGSLVIVDVVSHNFIGNGAQSKNKITHDIEAILSPEQIRHLAKKDFLPECFSSDALRKVAESANAATTEDGFLKTKNYVDDEDEDDEFSLGSRNVNRRVMVESDSSDEEDEDIEDEEEEDEESEQ